ncbi:MAG: FAD-dependent oxidoreductase [Clostridia bacterium]|nr:FAD-dependent oxidoreductase [Clostridia bacterium]
MITCELLVIGAGPAGLCSAITAAKSGASVVVLERSPDIGGQLIKQTHMFFGSKEQHASTRGVDIAEILREEIARYDIKLMLDTTALGIYEDGMVTALYKEEEYMKFKPGAIIVATGACERFLAFPNNDLPGVCGAGAVQTLMNVYGIMPAKDVVMLGAGNIGLIVSYQLMQAGVNVKCILDAAPKIGGYLVHASKVARMGVPIKTSHTVKRAIGEDHLTAVEIVALDDKFNQIPGTEEIIPADTLCVSVGLTPLCELLAMAGCKLSYIPQLGGMVPLKTGEYETSVPNIFVAGDTSGVEEASAAMVEGHIAGLCAAKRLGHIPEDFDAQYSSLNRQLMALRSGPAGEHIRQGLASACLNKEA